MRTIALLSFGVLASLSANAATVGSLKWQRRVLVVSAPAANDPGIATQRRIIASWQKQAAARDVTLVEIAGERVTGASDAAPALRRRYHLTDGTFEALLIGKDGTVAMRQTAPIAAASLESTIDSMPMRRAGQR